MITIAKQKMLKEKSTKGKFYDIVNGEKRYEENNHDGKYSLINY
ncbi:hypothetical protein [Neobacillus niacini]|nr:hypothetical protein [Neobacillus niacini]